MVSILHRELRIASRGERFLRLRVAIAAIAFICGLVLVLASRSSTGKSLFNTVVFLSFSFWFIQGVRRAASSISDEKRDGTLGLLFLTDLTPIGIVLGKLSSVAIPLIQPFLSFLPVLSISLLLGGITGCEVIRASLVLAGVLVYSISAGLFVSSFSRDSTQTGTATLMFLLATLIGPRMFGFLYAPVRWLSPWTAYNTISDPGYRVSPQDFWWSLLVMNLASAAFVYGAAYFLPRRWEKESIPATPKAKSARRVRFSAERRARILDRNPGEWLAMRFSSGLDRFFTAATFALALAAGIFQNAGQHEGAFFLFAAGVLLLLIRLCSNASYPLAEARRSGALEMLNTTPFEPKWLVQGQIVALRNQFLPLFGLLFISSFYCIMSDTAGVRLIGMLAILGAYWGFIALIASAAASLGMWMGLRSKTANKAFFSTLLFVLLVPVPMACLWFLMPFYFIALLIVSWVQLSGRDLERLVRGEKPLVELTPVIVPAPPVIRN